MKYIYTSFASVFLYIQLAVAQQVNQQEYKRGMVVSAHPEASKVGLEILKKGGNAIDAAVAVQFALAVVYPNAGNIGGGGFMVYRSAKGEIAALDYREKAPGLASRDMYLDPEGNPIINKSLLGHMAAGVPGTVDGMVKAHKRYGKLSWKDIVQPAVDLATKGFPITKKQSGELNRIKATFLSYNPADVAFVKQGGQWKEGDLLIQKELAHTFELIRDKGRAGFYGGEVADYMVKEMARGQGIISKKDLADYDSKWRTPITGNYKNYKIITMPPSSSGGIALVQLFHSVEPFPMKRFNRVEELNQCYTSA